MVKSSQGARKNFPGYVIVEPASKLLKIAGNGRRNAPRPSDVRYSGDYLISHNSEGKPSGWIRYEHRLERKRRTFAEAEGVANGRA